MAVTQYIGARYVPKFYENSDGTEEWRPGVEYEPLTIVTWNGNSYTSKKPIPSTVGSPSDNPSYWVATGIFNQQIADLATRVNALAQDMKKYFVTPEMFGAAGDGSTNDTAAMQDAVNSAYVVLLTGSYLIDTVNVTDEVYILGEGGQIIPTLTGTAPAPTKTAFNCSAPVVIDNVDFVGSLSATGDLVRYPVINSANTEDLTVKNCRFTNFGGEYVNQPGTAIWDFYAVYIKAVDVDTVTIENNTFTGRANDETIMITPHTKTTHSEIHLINNKFKDSTHGASLNLFATVINARGNHWSNYQYTGSAVNAGCEDLFFIGNTTDNCTFTNIIDTCEEAHFHSEHAVINDNIIKGSATIFADIIGSTLTLKNNYVEGGALVKHELTARQSDIVPVALQNSLKRNGSEVYISGNTIKIDNTGATASVFRAGCVAAADAGLYPANTYQCGGVCVIDNNMVLGMGGFVTEKMLMQIQVSFRRVSIHNNTINAPNRDQSSSSVKFLAVLDSRTMNTDAQIFVMDIFGNVISNMPSELSGGVYAIGQLRGSDSPAKPVSIIDMFHNHNMDGAFAVGIPAQYYDTLNS